MKKQSLNEHISRMKYLTKYNGKRVIAENVNIDPNQEAAFEKEMNAALSQVMQDLPGELAQAAQTGGNKDGQLDVAGSVTPNQGSQPNPQAQQPVQTPQAGQPTQPIQEEKIQAEKDLNEAVLSLIGGTALALPVITKLIGTAAAFLGKKVGSGDLTQFGQKAKNYAEKMHHTYEGLIDKALMPLTKNLDPAKRKTINKLVFYGIVASFFGVGASGALHAAGAGQAGLAAAEGGLSSIKFGELVAAARQVLPKVLASVGVM